MKYILFYYIFVYKFIFCIFGRVGGMEWPKKIPGVGTPIIILNSIHLESCTPGQDWANRYILVRTSTYWYNTVQGSTRISRSYVLVCTGTVAVHTSTYTQEDKLFPDSSRRVRRDRIKAVQLLCMGYNVAKSNFKTAQV